jgi:GNAT superfamily N-acetyltransferase
VERRVTLTPIDPSALCAALPWLDKSLTEAESLEPPLVSLLPGREGEAFALVLVGGEPAGYVGYALHAGLLTILALAIEPARRNLGFGAEAIYALEELNSAARALALVPLGNGLAVYFWLRVGYRPVFASDHGRHGFTVMRRVLR